MKKLLLCGLLVVTALSFGAQQTIDNGAGTPDSIRAAFDKVNDNFSEVYADFPIADGNLSSNVVLKDGVQTLISKTLTSPVINTPTGIVKGDVGLGNVDNTSNATERAAAVTLTNKTLTTPTIASFTNATHTHTDAASGGALGAIATVSSDQTAIGTSFADITSLSFSVLANASYEFKFLILADADATSTGIDIACNGPASPTFLSYEQRYWTSATAEAVAQALTYDANTASTTSNGTGARSFIITGVLVNGANAGTLSARIKRENVGTGPNVRPGSWGTIRRIS